MRGRRSSNDAWAEVIERCVGGGRERPRCPLLPVGERGPALEPLCRSSHSVIVARTSALSGTSRYASRLPERTITVPFRDDTRASSRSSATASEIRNPANNNTTTSARSRGSARSAARSSSRCSSCESACGAVCGSRSRRTFARSIPTSQRSYPASASAGSRQASTIARDPISISRCGWTAIASPLGTVSRRLPGEQQRLMAISRRDPSVVCRLRSTYSLMTRRLGTASKSASWVSRSAS